MARKIATSVPNSADAPSLSPEAEEQQMISLATNLAKKQLQEGTASSQVITHYLKLATEKERLERAILEKQKALIEAKTENYKMAQHMDEIYNNAITAMKKYSGFSSSEETEEEEEY